jgi:hypothetical protein
MDCMNQTSAYQRAEGLSPGAAMGAAASYSRDECAAAPTVRATVDVPAHHPFAVALSAVQQGHRITRRGWNGANQYVAAQFADKHSKMSAPYLYLKNAQNDLVPWVPSQGDLFAHDWAILPH